MKPKFLSRLCALTCATVFSLFAGKVSAQYCTPTYFQGCLLSSEINDFSITGDASTSISDLGTGCSSSGSTPPVTCYRDMHASMSVTMAAGGTYTVVSNTSATSITPANLQIFIDFNDDGTFDPSTESVGGGAFGAAGASTNFTINIPSTAAAGTHRMRAVSSGESTYPAISPCPAFSISSPSLTGEVHDYDALISGTATTCGIPTGLTASSVTTSSAVLNWSEPGGSVGSEYVVSTSSVTPAGSGTQTTALTYSPTGLTPATVYYAFVRDSCAATSLSAWVSTTFTTTATSTAVSNTTNVVSIVTYPNPVKDELTVKINGTHSDAGQLQLMDIAGKVIRTVAVSANTSSLNVSMDGLQAGIYLLRYSDGMHKQTIRVTKE